MQHIYIPLLFLAFLFLTACEKNSEEVDPKLKLEDIRPVTEITGMIMLPTGTNMSEDNLKVVSSWDSSAVTASNFSLEVIGKFSTIFVTDQAGEIFLMGYNYPGQQEFDITPKSTAVAMLMTSPTMQSLTEEGRLDAIRRLTKDANFSQMVEAIEESIVAGKPVTDPTNIRLLSVLGEMFKTASLPGARVTVVKPKPIVISRENREVTLSNNMVGHDYVAGLYKDRGKVGGPTIIKGIPLYASSVYEALMGLFYHASSEPDEQKILLKGDGQFSIRIRSGARDRSKSGVIDKSPERWEAQELNGSEYFLRVMLEHVPLEVECVNEIRNSLFGINNYASIMDDAFESKSLDEFNAAMLTFMVNGLKGSAATVKECMSSKPEKANAIDLFFKGVGNYLNFLSKDSKVAAACNLAAHQYDLYNSAVAIDTCFQAIGKVISSCDCLSPIDPVVEQLTGGSAQTWRLTGYMSDFYRQYNVNPEIVGPSVTLTFRSDNSITRTRYGASFTGPTLTGNGQEGQGKYEIVEIYGELKGDYCLKREGKILRLVDSTTGGFGDNYDMMITFSDPNTLVVTNLPGRGSFDVPVYTYTKQ